jgi:putative colanic acid biosynthesis UDP-glucose lipid carrier transferase
MVRHFVKPGITGLAQINGLRGETKEIHEMEGRIKKDIWYLENWSIVLDIEIIIRTVFIMIRGDRKAY